MVILVNDGVLRDGCPALFVWSKSGGGFEIAGERDVDDGGVELGMADDDSVVGFVGSAVLELFLEGGFGFGIFGEDDDAGGVAIEAMDDMAVGL